MSYRLSAQVIGAEELDRAFRQAPNIVGGELKNAIGRTAYTVQGKAQQYAPNDKGFLQSSITIKGPNVTNFNVEARVGTNIHYAPHQEFGTGIYGKRGGFITPKKGKVLAWKTGGKWHFARRVRGVRPKFYFKRAREESITVLTESLRSALAAIVGALTR